MRISIPTIPHMVSASNAQIISPAAAVERIANFLAPGNVTVLTGAGVSVDSGIRAYRGKDGRYMNPNYKPIFYHELIDETNIGYPPVRASRPNTTHFALAALQYTSHITKLITQNVDGLHQKSIAHLWDDDTIPNNILELHGTLHRVHCKFGHITTRDVFQDRLSANNPRWREYMDELERTGDQPRTNPDGDVALEGVSYDDFVVPNCPQCTLEGRHNSIQKPEVIFFGESIPKAVKERSYSDVEQCDRLFLVGTTLATYSAFRLLKHALDLRKPVMILNVGPTRADALPGVEKIELASGLIIRDVVRAVIGSRASTDPQIINLLNSGVLQPPDDDRVAKSS
ncbi:hypothetical protein SERLADRAFT_451291 [Serpula lacrymans var. lacrymans S7.9]|uniref:Deacetylase sirtuin-type domain-containing protein n=1 Tax=Serpula lacrymans var. lacrymans (strain S7.9) TaxID=578457 RepID=F8P2Q7_SERL9|nr:uncharacterized protein SERLADRAFT_451291 [Serpula lacrymans var. lacrymans S7.9]EGO22442.1 hypothetical protein SERLADRAFT_451291 [Serpula lacrymans var. lacrymans S7.9]